MHASLSRNLDELNKAFCAPLNQDFKTRRFSLGRSDALLAYVEGMCDEKLVNDFVLRQAAAFPDIEADEAAILRYIAVAGLEQEQDQAKVISELLNGKCAVIIDGHSKAVLLETKGYEHESISEPRTENVVLGSKEGFTGNMRTNVTLIRRMLRASNLVSEMLRIGKDQQMSVCMMYLNGVADPVTVERVRMRLQAIKKQFVPGAGLVAQFIEDRRFSIVPQVCMTERPDRCTSFLLEGQILAVIDGAPFVLAMPATFFHLFNTPDETFMRWEYGTLTRIIRYIGLFFALFLPAIFMSLVMHHRELIPIELLMSIIQARTDVPFSVPLEVLFMEVAFLIVEQSDIRIPSQIGSALSIFGALILGQAAAEAKLVSPVMIIVVALTALGSFCVPDYSLARSVTILRFTYIIAAWLGGFLGLTIAMFATLALICDTDSFGVPFFAPVSPTLKHNNDIIIRGPLQGQHSWRSMFRTKKGR